MSKLQTLFFLLFQFLMDDVHPGGCRMIAAGSKQKKKPTTVYYFHIILERPECFQFMKQRQRQQQNFPIDEGMKYRNNEV